MSINFLAVFAAAVVNMILGFGWYSKQAFWKPWVRLVGKTEGDIKLEMEKRNMPAVFVSQFIAALVTSYVLAHFVNYAGAGTLYEGGLVGLWVGVGFVLAVNLGGYLFENKPMKLFWINNGYNLVSLILTGALLAIWR